MRKKMRKRTPALASGNFRSLTRVGPAFLTGITVALALAVPAWAGPIVSFTNGSEAWWLLEADCATRDMVLTHSSPSIYTPGFRPPDLPVLEFDRWGEVPWNPFGPSSQVRVGAVLGDRGKSNCISLAPGEGVGIFTIPHTDQDSGKADTYFFQLTDGNGRLGPAFAVTQDGASGRWTSNWDRLNESDRSMMQSALQWDGLSALIWAEVWTLEWGPLKDPDPAQGERHPAGAPSALQGAGTAQSDALPQVKASRPWFKRRSPWQWFLCLCGCDLMEISEDE